MITHFNQLTKLKLIPSNKKYDVIILTDKRYLQDSETDAYKHNAFFEDYLVMEALRMEDLEVIRLAWDDKFFDWSNTQSVLFRSTWDYFERFEEFSVWLENVSKQTRLINSANIIRWNIDKHYLKDLKLQGIPIAESHFIEKGVSQSLKEIHKQLEWSETVLKPCVSGGGRHTYQLNLENIEAHESIFRELINNEAMLLQPFQHNIVSKGEISLMIFNGHFTHAILKLAKSGDFRVQEKFGGSVQLHLATEKQIKFAEKTVRACSELPMYARVDIFMDNNNKIALSELELIEPELWFRHNPEAATALAKAIKLKLNSKH